MHNNKNVLMIESSRISDFRFQISNLRSTSAHGPVGVRRMSAVDEGALEVEGVLVLDVAAFVLVFDAEAQELAPVPTEVGGDAPDFLLVVEGVLGPVEADAGAVVAVDLLLGQ